jgi:hypothetical protein
MFDRKSSNTINYSLIGSTTTSTNNTVGLSSLPSSWIPPITRMQKLRVVLTIIVVLLIMIQIEMRRPPSSSSSNSIINPSKDKNHEKNDPFINDVDELSVIDPDNEPIPKEQEELKPTTNNIDKIENDNNNDIVDITHIYPVYYARDSETKNELDAVISSWREAQKRALKANIRVEILGASLPEDFPGIPLDFVTKTKPLTWRAPGPDGNIKFPTVGETWARGAQEGRGKLLVYTNADIGTFPDFYIKVMELFREDAWSSKVNSVAFDKTIEFWQYCRSNNPRSSPSSSFEKDWFQMCKEDAQVFFINMGGAPHVLDLDMANMMEKELFSGGGGGDSGTVENNKKPEMIQQLKELLLAAVSQVKKDQRPLSVTITRLDILDPDAVKNSNSLSSTNKVSTHPGNDCFVLPRSAVPREIWDWGHPVGFRPWGWWLPSLLQETTRFRRIVGTSQERYTFHVNKGLWGMKNDGFERRATDNPSWAAFLAGNWFAITRGKFAHDFENTPDWCTESFFVTHQAFCRSAKNSAFCQGTAPLSCSGIRPHSRDANIYLSICQSSTLYPLREALVKEPICSFCRFLLKRVKKDRSHLKCIKPPFLGRNNNNNTNSNTDVSPTVPTTVLDSSKPIPYLLNECSQMDCVSYRKDWLGILPEYKA